VKEQNPQAQQMQPRVNVITLGVGNLERSLAFYRDGLGLQSAGIIGTEFAATSGRREALRQCSSSTTE
jgi:catechol-2,3-dioxygenase